MKAIHNMEGVQILPQDLFNAPPPQRQVWVSGLGDFWGEAMATAIVSMCFLAGEWAGFSVRRLREEMERAGREEFHAQNTIVHNILERRRVRKEKVGILFLSVLTLGLWWLLNGRPWPRLHLLPVGVPRILPAPFSPQGLDWLLEKGYIRRKDVGGELFVYPEPKLARETRWQWDPPEDD